MAWVIDCSLALAWGLPDEQSPKADDFFRLIILKRNFWFPPFGGLN